MLTAFKIGLLVLSIGLVIVVLLQKGKSAGLSGAITGGAEHLFGRTKARGLDLFLSRVTLVLAILFIILTAMVAYSNEIPWLAEKSETATTNTQTNTNSEQSVQVKTAPADAKTEDANAKKSADSETKSSESSEAQTEPGNAGAADADAKAETETETKKNNE